MTSREERIFQNEWVNAGQGNSSHADSRFAPSLIHRGKPEVAFGGENSASPSVPSLTGSSVIDGIKIGSHYDTTSGTLWKDGTYFPRGSRVLVVGMHIDQGFCVRFPTDGPEPLETWEGWEENDFLAEEGTISEGDLLTDDALDEARAMLADAEDGCHLHLQED